MMLGNAGQQLDRDADRPPQPHRAQLGEEDRDQQPDRHRDQHRDERRDERAVDRRERTELLGDRVPALLEQKVEAERLQRRQRALDQGEDDAAEDDQDADRRALGQQPEDDVAEAQALEHLGPRHARRTLMPLQLVQAQRQPRQVSRQVPSSAPCLPIRSGEPTQAAVRPRHKAWSRSRQGRREGALQRLLQLDSINARPRTAACRPRP